MQFAETTPTKPRRRAGRIVLIVIAAVLGACGLGSVIAVAAGGEDSTGGQYQAATHNPGTSAATAAVKPAAEPVRRALTAKDITLKVKITDKQCFGTVVCNVQWSIRAAWPTDRVKDTCEVTYDMGGINGGQVGTLTLKSDGTFDQDSYQFGQTARESTKVTARVTEVEC